VTPHLQIDVASAAQAKALLNNYKFPLPSASSSHVLSALGSSGCTQHDSGIAILYAIQNSEEQLRELERLDARINVHRRSSNESGEGVAVSDALAAELAAHWSGRRPLSSMATGSDTTTDHVDHVVLAGSPPSTVLPRALTDSTIGSTAAAAAAAAASTCVLSNGPPSDAARLTALLESGTANSTLYIERLPLDATEREVAHIFRPFSGFISVRVRPTTSKRNPTIRYLLCFVDFDSPRNAAIALDARQAYQLGSCDERGLKITFASRSTRPSRFAVTH
jgi:hypothetical protein